jgi:hypothetical protein
MTAMLKANAIRRTKSLRLVFSPVEIFTAGELIDTLSYLSRLVLRHLYIEEEPADQTPSD